MLEILKRVKEDQTSEKNENGKSANLITDSLRHRTTYIVTSKYKRHRNKDTTLTKI